MRHLLLVFSIAIVLYKHRCGFVPAPRCRPQPSRLATPGSPRPSHIVSNEASSSASESVFLDPVDYAEQHLRYALPAEFSKAWQGGLAALSMLSASLRGARRVKIPTWMPPVFSTVSIHAVFGVAYLLVIAANFVCLLDFEKTLHSGVPVILDLTKPVDMTLLRWSAYLGWIVPLFGIFRLDDRETKTNLKTIFFRLVVPLNMFFCISFDSNLSLAAADGPLFNVWSGPGSIAYMFLFLILIAWFTYAAHEIVVAPEKGREQVYAMQPRWFAITYNYLLGLGPLFVNVATAMWLIVGNDQQFYANYLTENPGAKWALAHAYIWNIHFNNLPVFYVTLTNRQSSTNGVATTIILAVIGWFIFLTGSLVLDMWPTLQIVGAGTATASLTVAVISITVMTLVLAKLNGTLDSADKANQQPALSHSKSKVKQQPSLLDSVVEAD